MYVQYRNVSIYTICQVPRILHVPVCPRIHIKFPSWDVLRC